jgi:hypothetical protein
METKKAVIQYLCSYLTHWLKLIDAIVGIVTLGIIYSDIHVRFAIWALERYFDDRIKITIKEPNND